jgi:hypothetical protein
VREGGAMCEKGVVSSRVPFFRCSLSCMAFQTFRLYARSRPRQALALSVEYSLRGFDGAV